MYRPCQCIASHSQLSLRAFIIRFVIAHSLQKSPERPKTPHHVAPAKTLPQAIPGKTPSSITGPHTNTTKVASKVSAGAISLTDHVESPRPLVGNKVEFLHKVNHYAINNWTEMAEKLQQLPSFSGWRSIRGRRLPCLPCLPFCVGHDFQALSALPASWFDCQRRQAAIIASPVA